jgi:hypothetical protein
MSENTTHCDCIKAPGGIRGFGAWCKDHHRLLEDYEFQKAKADEVVRRYGELEASLNAALRRAVGMEGHVRDAREMFNALRNDKGKDHQGVEMKHIVAWLQAVHRTLHPDKSL